MIKSTNEKWRDEEIWFLAQLKGAELTSTQKFMAKIAHTISKNPNIKIIERQKTSIKTLIDSYNKASDKEKKETARFIKSITRTNGAKKSEETQNKKQKIFMDELDVN